MKTIYCKTLEEFNSLPDIFAEYTAIHILFDELVQVVARGNSRVVARGNSRVEAWENSQVEAWENSRVKAWGNSRVKAWGNSQVVAWENSRVEARGNSRVEARGNSQVEARGNSRVVAWGNSRVEAWENSRVEAWGNSQVEAWGNNSIYNCSQNTDISLMFYSVCWMTSKCNKFKQSKTSTVIHPVYDNDIETFLDMHCIIPENDKVNMFKRVSCDLKTQEKTKNETIWDIGATLTVPNWNPSEECGEGKFHACPKTFFCDEFRSEPDDRYIMIEIDVCDLHTHKNPTYPHKIAFRKGKVICEVDRYGNKI